MFTLYVPHRQLIDTPVRYEIAHLEPALVAWITSPTPSLLSFLFAVIRCSSPLSLLPLVVVAVAVVATPLV
ncbi:hypothetical protein BHE74_00056793, partial [Ensete ventricosum]